MSGSGRLPHREARDGRQALGLAGEAAAREHLTAQGYEVIAANVRCRLGEIDLIARDGEYLVFVEVRTRRGRALGTPAESITPRKRARLAQLARWYLGRSGLTAETACRFDVVCVTAGPNGVVQGVEVIQDAFRPG